MRKRYVTASTKRPRLCDCALAPLPMVGMVVHEPEPCVYDTGLLDADGNPIRYEEVREPIGFIHAND